MKQRVHTDKLLQVTFSMMLIYRFLLPLFDNPLNHIFSDPARHWQNGIRLLTPNLMGSVDPKAYQLYIWLIHLIGDNNPGAIALITGLLCASMAWVWYGMCTELFSGRTALIMGIIIGLTPSLTMIYTLFMNETLLLVLVGAAFWMTLKASRTKNIQTAFLAIVFTVLACLTRLIALPIMLMSLWYVFFFFPKGKSRLFSVMMRMCIICVIPAAMHSYYALNIIAPFGYTGPNTFYYYSNAQTYEISDKNRGIAGFKSPSFGSNPLAPLLYFESCRTKNIAKINIDTAIGKQDWEAKTNEAESKFSMQNRLCAISEDAIYFMFGISWPDSTNDWSYSKLYFINYQMRWMWFPLIALVLISAPFIKRKPSELLIIACSIALIFILITQSSGIMEGRYRKPLEPLLLISTAIILRRKPTSQDISLWQFGTQTYLKPPALYIIKNIKERFGKN